MEGSRGRYLIPNNQQGGQKVKTAMCPHPQGQGNGEVLSYLGAVIEGRASKHALTGAAMALVFLEKGAASLNKYAFTMIQ